MKRFLARVRGGLSRLRPPPEDSAHLVYTSVPLIEKALAAYRTDRLAQGTPEALEAAVRRFTDLEPITDVPVERFWFGCIRSSAWADSIIWINRLASALPGTTAAPRSPRAEVTPSRVCR